MRKLIQDKLNELENIKCGVIVADDVVENNTTYFGYTLQQTYVSSDQENNRTIRATIIGYLVRKKSLNENTLSILDNASDEIVDKLKELNFKLSVQDINISENVEKQQISGYVYFNEINNRLVI